MLLNDALAAERGGPLGGGRLPIYGDFGPAPGSALPADTTAIIHCPALSVMSSGRRLALPSLPP